MAWAVALPDDTSKIRLSAGYIRNNNAAIQGVLTAANLLGPTPYIPDMFPMYFYSDTPPTGWTIYAAIGDCLLAIKDIAGGGGAYDVAGGTLVGVWTGPAHTLTIPEMPAHTHSFSVYGGAGSNPHAQGNAGPVINTPATSSTGGGGAHQHDWLLTRPKAALGILCTKDA